MITNKIEQLFLKLKLQDGHSYYVSFLNVSVAINEHFIVFNFLNKR